MVMVLKINKIHRKNSLTIKKMKSSNVMMIQTRKIFKKMKMIKVRHSKKATTKK
jgi:hypothetical protein